MRVGEVAEADVEGCVLLQAPQLLNVQGALSSPTVPVLSLIDRLHELGFTPFAGAVKHTPVSARVYDSRSPTRKGFYYQVLLCMDELFRNHIGEFSSLDPAARFELLLKYKAPAPRGLKAAEYKNGPRLWEVRQRFASNRCRRGRHRRQRLPLLSLCRTIQTLQWQLTSHL